MATWKRGLAAVASIGLIGAMVAGCGTSSQGTSGSVTSNGGASGAPREGGSIKLDSIANFKDLDPALAYDTGSAELVSSIYEPLVSYQGTTNNISSVLAEKYQVSEDGKTYTFQIRKGVKFSNGDPLTAQNFVDEFKRVLDPQIASPGAPFINPIIQGSADFASGKAKDISGITTPDPYTLKIQLTQPEPFFLEVLAMPFFSAVDQKFINSVGDKAFDTSKTMGTGPFTLDPSFDNQTAVLNKNPNYWGTDGKGNKLPYLDKITISVDQNAQIDSLHFQQGQTAMMANLLSIPSASYPTFLAQPKLKSTILKAPENAVFYLGMNTHTTPFNNVKVRQAVAYAINQNKIIQLMNNRVVKANQILPPGVTGHDNNIPADLQYSQNIAKAKELLKEAGYANGFTTELDLYSNPDREKFADSIQNDLSQIGIKVKIVSTDWNTFLMKNESGKTPMFISGWDQDFPDASDFLNTLFNSAQPTANNPFQYKNAQVDAWLNQAQTDTNQSERNALYNKVTEQLLKDVPAVPLYFGEFVYAIQPWVHNYYINPSLWDPLKTIWIDPGHDQ